MAKETKLYDILGVCLQIEHLIRVDQYADADIGDANGYGARAQEGLQSGSPQVSSW